MWLISGPATHFQLHLNPSYHFQLFFSPPQPSSILFQSLSILYYIFTTPFNYIQLLPPPSPSVPGSDLDPFLFGDHDNGPCKFFLSLYSLFLHDGGLFALPFVFPPPTLIPTLPIWDCAMSSHHHGYYGPLFLQRFPLIGYPQSVPSPLLLFRGIISMTVMFSSVSISTYYYFSFGYYTTLHSSFMQLVISFFGFYATLCLSSFNSLFSPWFYTTRYFFLGYCVTLHLSSLQLVISFFFWVLCNQLYFLWQYISLSFEFYVTRYLFSLGFVQPVIIYLISLSMVFCCGSPCCLHSGHRLILLRLLIVFMSLF